MGLVLALAGFIAFFTMWVILPKFLQNRTRANTE